MQSFSPIQVPEQFAGVYGLGSPVQVFSARTTNRWVSALSGVICLGLAGLAFLYGLYDAYVQTAKYGPLMLESALLPPLIISGILGLVGVLFAINAWQNWNKIAVLYQNGLAYHDNKGLQLWNWQEVSLLFVSITRHYTNGIYTGTTYQYTLQKSDGNKLILGNKLQSIEVLGGAISKAVAPFQYQALINAFQSSQGITLGPIQINKESLVIGKKTFPWNEIEQVVIQNGYLSVQKRGGGWLSGASAPAAAIPNFDALMAVLEQITKVKAG